MRLLLATAFLVGACFPATADSDPFAFPEPGSLAKPWTRAWWLGSAVDKENLTKWLESMSAAGLGGVEIVPIYGVKGNEQNNLQHLSPEWLAMMAHTTNEAARLGMGVDMPTGTGWPFGGPTVTPEDADAKLTVAKVDVAASGDVVGVPEDGALHAFMAYGADGAVLDLTDQVKDGKFSGTLPEGTHTFYVAYYRFSGSLVERAGPGGAGRVLNSYSGEALQRYLAHFSTGWDHFDGTPLRAFSHDSFEYGGDWTPAFWTTFEKQHGYDLRHHLPELAGEGDEDRVARIKADYRTTLGDLLLKDYIAQWTEWTHAQGSRSRNQAHGSPGNLLDLYAASDIPETEIFGPSGFPIPGLRKDPNFDNEPPDLLMLKFSSSAAHTTGKPLISAETCTWLGEHFQVALSQCKPEIDQLLAAGINNIAYHGTPYSPADAPWPGWLFYASVHFAPTNPWWDDFKFLNAYVARSQALLQECTPANDVLLYFPINDVWHDPKGLRKQLTVHNIDQWLIGTPFYDTAKALAAAGHSFDYVSDTILQGATVERGRVLLGGNHYAVLVIPETPRMTPETLAQLFKLAEAGATVAFLGKVPEDVPGFGNLEARRDALKTVQGTRSSAGRIYEAQPLEAVLSGAGVAPETLATSGLSMIRLKHAEGWLYFVANLTAKPVDDFWTLATPARSVVLLDTLNERAGLAQTKMRDGATAVRIALEPGESCFLRTYAEREVTGAAWPYWQPAGEPVAVEGEWDVTFLKGGPEIPEPWRTTKLESWTIAPDEEVKRFVGTARYTINFDAPGVKPEAWRLELGKVCESARVTLNGEFLGCVWSLPATLTFRQPLRPKANWLEIDVSNLAANRIADMDRRKVDWKIFEEINFVNIQYKPFDASGWPLMDSGLLGPVRLVPLRKS
jgi:hypothetical protein